MNCSLCHEPMTMLRDRYEQKDDDGVTRARSEFHCEPCQVGAHPVLRDTNEDAQP